MNKNTYLKNTIVLMLAMAITKAVGAIFKIPLANILGGTGMGYFSTAYGLYSPVFAVTAAGIPTVMLKITAQNVAKNRYLNAHRQKRTALLLFSAIGAVGMIIIFVLAKPFSQYVASSDNSLLSLYMIAPAVFFCCISSVIRGYYEGLSDMVPSAVSQVVEAVVRAIFGLALSYGVVAYGMEQYESSGLIFGNIAATYSEATMLILPYAASAAVLAVTLSEFFAMAVLIIRDKFGKKRSTLGTDLYVGEPKKQALSMLKELLPIAAGAVVMNLISFIDLITVSMCLDSSIGENKAYFLNRFAFALDTQTGLSGLSNFMYGSYTGISVSLFMLVPSFCTMMEKSALPFVAEAWEKKDCKSLTDGLTMVFRGVTFTGAPACLGLTALSVPVLNLLFGERQNELAVCTPSFVVLTVFGIFMIVTSSAFSIMQSVGLAHIPLKIMLVGVASKLILNLILLPIPVLNITACALSTGISYFVTAVLGIYSLKKYMSCDFNFFAVISKPIISGILCAAAAFLSRNYLFYGTNDAAAIVLSIITGAFFYVISLILFEGKHIKNIIKLKKQKNTQNHLQIK